MSIEIHRHNISDIGWDKIKPHTIGEKGTREGKTKNTRQFINGVFWILRTGALWRELPMEYGHWKNVHCRFCRWRDNGIWDNILNALINDVGFEWLMINATYVKVHADGTGARGGNQGIGLAKVG